MHRPSSIAARLAGALLALGAGAAAAVDEDKKPCLAQQASEEDKQRLILNEGYSLLRRDAYTIKSVKWLLLVKTESDAFDRLLRDLSGWAARLDERLQALPERFPFVRTDLDPLPVIERRKRLATGWDKFKDIAPVVGASGADYERRLLISLTNGLNQERHLVEVLAGEESDPALKKLMQETHAEMNAFFDRADRMLQAHFR